MELLSVDLAQSLWFGHTIDFNPRGMALSHVAVYLASVYKFKKLPPPDIDPNNIQSAKFENGEFFFKEGEAPISVTFTLYPEGMTADTRFSTECSDAFLVDLFKRLSQEFKIPSYDAIIRHKRYLSQLWVSTNKLFKTVNPKLQEIAMFLSENVDQEGGIPFEFGGISFWPEQSGKFPPPAFTIEKAINVPFSENRYFSRAPLETEKHLELLSKLESILS